MLVVEAVVTVPVPPDVAFAVSQTTGLVRLRWDPFICRQYSRVSRPAVPIGCGGGRRP